MCIITFVKCILNQSEAIMEPFWFSMEILIDLEILRYKLNTLSEMKFIIYKLILALHNVCLKFNKVLLCIATIKDRYIYIDMYISWLKHKRIALLKKNK